MTGSLTARQRERLLQQVQAGEVDLVIGTQALLHESLLFPTAGAGGDRRAAQVRRRGSVPPCSSAGADPHYLVMTATPIPRTVTMSLFGDLDVSTIRQAPPGRQTVHTYLGAETSASSGGSSFATSCAKGGRAM